MKVLLGLIGSPISHSASPAMHEAAGAACGLRVHYQLIDNPDPSHQALRPILEGVRRLGFAGVNVTYPCKEAVVPLLDGLAPGIAEIAAVNTVVVTNGRLIGHNTDCTGFRAALLAEIDAAALHAPIALIGCGGVGRAIAVALIGLGTSQIRLYERDAARARRLAADLGPLIHVCESVEAAMQGVCGVINATPLGMLPDTRSPVPAKLLHAGLFVADAVYNPLITPLLAAAQAVGAQVLTGRELAIHQAADAFRLFTGQVADLRVMGDAFDRVIAARAP